MPDSDISRVDLYLASHGLVFAPNIIGRAITVGTALLRFRNFESGRCDPGFNRLARATGLSRSTVIRAVDDLCTGEPPLFYREKHAGHYYTNQYTPNVALLKSYCDAYDRRAGIKKD